jgi:hypothetical protein
MLGLVQSLHPCHWKRMDDEQSESEKSPSSNAALAYPYNVFSLPRRWASHFSTTMKKSRRI